MTLKLNYKNEADNLEGKGIDSKEQHDLFRARRDGLSGTGKEMQATNKLDIVEWSTVMRLPCKKKPGRMLTVSLFSYKSLEGTAAPPAAVSRSGDPPPHMFCQRLFCL